MQNTERSSGKEKFQGVLPAFYACYNEKGEVSPERTEALAEYLMEKGVQGLYVCGSSGECIYQSVEERKLILEHVMRAVGTKLTVIAHVGANSTRDSMELARHAEEQGADAVAAIPPIYFKLPEHAIAEYWNDISAAAPRTDFVIYNIPQLAGVSLTTGLFLEMLKNPRVAAVKNSSMPVQDIQNFKALGGPDFTVFNGPDEQFVGGRAMGADGGIGGTYAVMPELFLKMDALVREGRLQEAREIQYAVNGIITAMCSCRGNLYAVMKEILRHRGLELGDVRRPLPSLRREDMPQVRESIRLIDQAMEKYR